MTYLFKDIYLKMHASTKVEDVRLRVFRPVFGNFSIFRGNNASDSWIKLNNLSITLYLLYYFFNTTIPPNYIAIAYILITITMAT